MVYKSRLASSLYLKEIVCKFKFQPRALNSVPALRTCTPTCSRWCGGLCGIIGAIVLIVFAE